MLDYDDFALVMDNEKCCLCNSHIEQPYEGAVVCTSDEDDEEEFINVMVYCSYCWPRIKRSMKRIKKKLVKETVNLEKLSKEIKK